MPAQERKRPWYLVLALPAALALGMLGACNGWATVTYYRLPIDPGTGAGGIVDEADRAAVEARYEAFMQTLDAAKPRGWPLAVGTLVLGSAMIFFAMRAMGGSRSARVALVQLAIAQAAVNATSYWLLRDVDAAEMRWIEAGALAARAHDSVLPRPPADDYAMVVTDRLIHVFNPIRLALKTLGSALVVIALTRRGSRDFFDAAGAAIEER
jgi:hypothetical protein